MLNPDDCPFGPLLQRYWDKRYDFFQRFDEGIQTDAEGLHTVMPEAAALAQARLLPEAQILVDGFCGIGGAAIAHARAGKQVIGIELNEQRLAMAKHNAEIYGVSAQMTFIHGDFFKVIPHVTADALIIDPPWGWPRQRKLETFLLTHFEPDGTRILDVALSHFNTIIFRTPTYFDVSELNAFNGEYTVFDDKLNQRVISKSILIKKR